MRTKIAIVGCGNISGIYLKNLTTVFADTVEIVAVCDLIPERALNAQEKYNIPKAVFTDEEIMNDPEIELVLNLTTPDQHKFVNMMALRAGKHAYCEKPLACTREDGIEQVEYAREHGLLLGGAPDTFLGGGIQTCRKLIDDGWIGTPVAVTASMLCRGHESWHPDPEFYYKPGAGPMFDMGPYYLTALVNLMGRVKSVAASTRITFPTRTITSEKKYGQIVDVEVPTHIAGILNFESGAIGTLVTSFDTYNDIQAGFTVYGSAGTIRVPDPNTFGGPIQILLPGAKDWQDVPVVYGYQENSRGLGVADFCRKIRALADGENGEMPRCHCEQTFHVLDLMCAFHEASDQGKVIELQSPYTRKSALELNK